MFSKRSYLLSSPVLSFCCKLLLCYYFLVFALFFYYVPDRFLFRSSCFTWKNKKKSQTSDVDFLFGLDMLKRHLCVIDLKSGVLALGSAGAAVPFLSEKDLPPSARETKASLQNLKSYAEPDLC